MASLILGILIAVLDIVALFDVLFSIRPAIEKLLWVIVILLLPVLGLLLYFLFGRSRGDRPFVPRR